MALFIYGTLYKRRVRMDVMLMRRLRQRQNFAVQT
jgi:hypothetical protein